MSVELKISKNMFEMNNISKYKVELMGVSAILIFAGHCANVNILSGGGYIKKIFKVLPVLGGSISVDIFCLLSGMGVVYSLKKNTNMEYVIKRLTRVYMPYFLIALIGNLLINYENFSIYVLKLSTIYFWIFGNDGTWFVPFILLMYGVALILRPLYKNNSFKIECIWSSIFVVISWLLLIFLNLYQENLMDRLGIALNRIPIFFIGIIIGQCCIRKIKINNAYIIFLFGGMILKSKINSISVVGTVLSECRSLFFVILEILALTVIVKMEEKENILGELSAFLHKCIVLCGKLSLEIYLIHIFILNWIKSKPYVLNKMSGNFLAFVIYAIFTIVLSIVISKIENVIKRKKIL